MVYVLDKNGKPLMPTERHGKVRRLLKEHKAIVVKKVPFTIQLLYETTEFTQPITLGVDAGYSTVGVSATTEIKELYAEEVTLRNDIVRLLAERATARNHRRYWHTRYRQARYNNRRKPKGWIAPSVQHRINTHLTIIVALHEILPITTIIVETAMFDIQKLKNPDISGIEYQRGEQYGFDNVREYVLWRDNHKCQCCHGKSGDQRLNTHHIESQKTGGDAPNNFVTLCKTCHQLYHQGLIQLPSNIKRGKSYKSETFMGFMRWRLFDALKERYSDVHMTYGYITKHIRIANHLLRTPWNDARCISTHPTAKPIDVIYSSTKQRRHNRKLYKDTIRMGGKKQAHQCPNVMFGYRLHDIVKYQNETYMIHARRSSGCFVIRHCQTDEQLHRTYKHLQLIRHSNGFVTIPKSRQLLETAILAKAKQRRGETDGT